MTTHVVLNEQGNEPLRLEDEFFILKRNDITYRIILESNYQYEGEGYLILTSNRLVIFPKNMNNNYRAIEIPLNQIYSEEFKQPIFGKNYLTGKCRPYFQSQFGNFTFTIWLKGNRVGTLIGTFFTLIDSLRNNQGRNHNLNIIQNLRDNNFNAIFAIDPEDVSYIYPTQPPAAIIPRQNFQSVIINRPNNNINNIQKQNQNINQNNNNYPENFSRLNEEEINHNNINNIYMSHFAYKRPNDNFVYKDPGFVYKEPVYPNNNINNNINNKANNNINNANNNVNYNIYNVNINNNRNIPNNNNIKKEEEDEDDLVSPYNIQKKVIPNNYNANANQNNNNININNNVNNIINYNQNNIPRAIINSNPQPIIPNQIINRNIQLNNNKNNEIDIDSPYMINNINRNNPPHINQGYPIQNNNINQMNSPYGHVQGTHINNNNININNKIHINNNNIINKNKNKYRQLNEEIPDENELNSKNKLYNNDFNESNISFENKQDLSLISHKEDSLPDMSNIYPEL